MPSSRGSSQPRRLNPSLLCLLHWQAGSLPLVLPGKPHNVPECDRNKLCGPSLLFSVVFINSYITDSVDMNLSILSEIVKDTEALGATVHGVRELDTT